MKSMAIGRRLKSPHGGGGYELREGVSGYNQHFGPEKSDMEPNFQYHNLITDIIRPKITVTPPRAILSWGMGHPSLSSERHLSESVLVLFITMLRFMTGNRLHVTEVRFAHPRPGNTAEHERIFQAPILFGHGGDAVVLPATYMGMPILFANPSVMEGLEQLVQNTLHRSYALNPWKEKVSQVLLRALIRGKSIDMDSISGQLAMTKRNLQLKLKGEGTSFRNLIDDVRKEIAIGYLEDENASICEIALLLGFSDQSAFQHAFKRWTGTTPGKYLG